MEISLLLSSSKDGKNKEIWNHKNIITAHKDDNENNNNNNNKLMN